MVKKLTGGKDASAQDGKKSLNKKTLKLKKLHREVGLDRIARQGLPPDQLPPASSSNAARQARSRLNITFPVNWQALHLRKSSALEPQQDADGEDGTEERGD